MNDFQTGSNESTFVELCFAVFEFGNQTADNESQVADESDPLPLGLRLIMSHGVGHPVNELEEVGVPREEPLDQLLVAGLQNEQQQLLDLVVQHVVERVVFEEPENDFVGVPLEQRLFGKERKARFEFHGNQDGLHHLVDLRVHPFHFRRVTVGVVDGVRSVGFGVKVVLDDFETQVCYFDDGGHREVGELRFRRDVLQQDFQKDQVHVAQFVVAETAKGRSEGVHYFFDFVMDCRQEAPLFVLFLVDYQHDDVGEVAVQLGEVFSCRVLDAKIDDLLENADSIVECFFEEFGVRFRLLFAHRILSESLADHLLNRRCRLRRQNEDVHEQRGNRLAVGTVDKSFDKRVSLGEQVRCENHRLFGNQRVYDFANVACSCVVEGGDVLWLRVFNKEGEQLVEVGHLVDLFAFRKVSQHGRLLKTQYFRCDVWKFERRLFVGKVFGVDQDVVHQSVEVRFGETDKSTNSLQRPCRL